MSNEERDYDYDGYIAKYGVPDQSKGQHLTDEFKLPNHITFSKESKYHSEETPGGEWVKDEEGRWNFFASQYNVQNSGLDRLVEYFNSVEKDATLHLPAPYKSSYTELSDAQSTPIREAFKKKLKGSGIEELINDILFGK